MKTILVILGLAATACAQRYQTVTISPTATPARYYTLGAAAPELDFTHWAAAVNFNGATATNGNLVFNPGNVAGNASVVVNAARADQPALYLKSVAGTTTAPIFSLRDSSNVSHFYVMQSGDAACANCVNTETVRPISGSTFKLGDSTHQWSEVWGILGQYEVLVSGFKASGGLTAVSDARLTSNGNLAVHDGTGPWTSTSAFSDNAMYLWHTTAGRGYIMSHDNGSGAEMQIGNEDSTATPTNFLRMRGAAGSSLVAPLKFAISTPYLQMVGDLFPDAANTRKLGDTGLEWNEAHFKDVTVTGTCTGCGTTFPIVFPSGTAAPQLDATGLGAALNVNGSSSTNGNIVLNPGNVSGNASVVANATRTDQPALYLKSASGTTTAPVLSLRDSSNVAKVWVMQAGDATCPNCINTQKIIPTAHATYDIGEASNRYSTIYGGSGNFSSILVLGSANLTPSGTRVDFNGGATFGGAISNGSGAFAINSSGFPTSVSGVVPDATTLGVPVIQGTASGSALSASTTAHLRPGGSTAPAGVYEVSIVVGCSTTDGSHTADLTVGVTYNSAIDGVGNTTATLTGIDTSAGGNTFVTDRLSCGFLSNPSAYPRMVLPVFTVYSNGGNDIDAVFVPTGTWSTARFSYIAYLKRIA